MPKARTKKEVAELQAFDTDGVLLEEITLSLEEYYEGSNELIDSEEYRASHGVAVIKGKLFDPSGKLDQEFSNRYSTSGAYVGGRTVYADGTVNED